MSKRRRSRRKRRPSVKGSEKYDKLYLLERVSERTTLSRMLMLHEVKIGVTSKPVKDRVLDIDEDVPGDVNLQTWIFIPGRAYYYEQKLLDKYRDKAWNPGGGPSAGNTEWLRITWSTYLCIHLDFWLIRHRGKINLAITLLILALIAYGLYLDNFDLTKYKMEKWRN